MVFADSSIKASQHQACMRIIKYGAKPKTCSAVRAAACQLARHAAKRQVCGIIWRSAKQFEQTVLTSR